MSKLTKLSGKGVEFAKKHKSEIILLGVYAAGVFSPKIGGEPEVSDIELQAASDAAYHAGVCDTLGASSLEEIEHKLQVQEDHGNPSATVVQNIQITTGGDFASHSHQGIQCSYTQEDVKRLRDFAAEFDNARFDLSSVPLSDAPSASGAFEQNYLDYGDDGFPPGFEPHPDLESPPDDGTPPSFEGLPKFAPDENDFYGMFPSPDIDA